ncbi:MAG: glycine zipper 2TM domain-containing protein [Gammaproteobacteria bacterium]|nr:glycine zipper 2TM domain-containing protein [Pseudomonadales bacterium]MCP5345662.1 glycine zipper 2TM domain-containing protein [Pseudomonadales bacterium]
MKKHFTKAALGLATLVVAGTTLAQVEYDYAEVVDVRPIVRVVEISTPQEQCWEEEYLVDRPARRSESGTPTIVGTIIGGAIGNAVGHNKSNKRVGTVVGAVLGHSIARDIMRQDTGTGVREVETVQRCETVYQSHEEERIMGYNVTYHYNGQDYTVRTDSDPGSQIRVRVSVEPVL